MTDDIVTRLRELGNMGGFLVTVEAMFEAANEIERLRTELKQTKQQLEYERSMEFD